MKRRLKYFILICCTIILTIFLGHINEYTVAQTPAVKASQGVGAIAFSADGKTLAAGKKNGEIVLLNPDNGQEKQRLKGHSGLPVTKIAFNPRSGKVATVGRDTVLRIWGVEKGEEIYNPTGHENPTRAVAYSPDGKTVATGGEDSRIAIWDDESGKLRQILKGHRGFVNDVVFSPDGAALASASNDGTIKFWNLRTSEETRTLLGHADGVTSIAFSPDGKLLASASNDATVRIWQLASGESQILKGPAKKVRTVSFSPDGKILVGGSDEGKLFSWDVATGRPRGTIQSKKKSIAAVAFNPANPDNLVSIDDDTDEVDFWGLSRGTQLKPSIPVLSKLTTQVNQRKNLKAQKSSSQSNTDTFSVKNQSLIATIPSPPGGPILLVTSSANKFGDYYAEILRNEGFNYFNVSEITSVTASTLASYDIVILADMSLTAAQVTTFTNWVNSGGNLIAMHPDKQLATLLGLTDAGTTLSEGYLLVDTSKAPGNGIVNQTIQFHGTADRYNLNGASSLATLYTNDTTPTANNPAVTLRSVGSGQAAAFTYDLARSVVYTRQGNPAWAGQERDNQPPIRSDDQFFGVGGLDWVNLNKVAIPQADEQQRLLANLIIKMNLAKKPLPRFWYLPNGKKAVVLMTGDDHGNGGTVNRFNQFNQESNTGCNVDNWECIRGTSYIFPNTAITDAQAASFNNQGFEIALHVNTNCADYTPSSLATNYTQQLAQLGANFPSLPASVTQRHHCLVWSDWSGTPEVELSKGIRLDTTYYYWPPNWVNDRPGFFTGSGMPMRFTKTDGTILDVYKAATQMTDESGQSYPFTINTLLDRALGAEGYYGVFNINAHTDNSGPTSQSDSDAVVAVAKNRSVSVISAKQLLTWLDGRNSSSFNSLSWNNTTNQLSFSITKASGANGLQAMLPTRSTNGILSSITRNGSTIYTPSTGTTQGIKGVEYALFSGDAGSYIATYAPDTTAPQVITDPTLTPPSPANGATSVSVGTTVSATFNEAIDPATINANSFELRDAANTLVGATVTYNAATRTATLNSISNLTGNTTYTARLKGGIVKDQAGNSLAADFTWTFTTVGLSCSEQQPCSIWTTSTIPANQSENDSNAVELGVKFRSDIDGYITGIRFYKGNTNTGNYIVNLWNSNGQNIGTATRNNLSASGWQQVNFASPVAITANTTYIASYYTSIGRYASDNGFFASSGVYRAPLRALSNGESGGNGLYKYGSSGFPNNTYQSSNYWVDALFSASVTADTTPPTVISNTPSNSSTGVAISTTVQATFSEAMNSSTINSSTFQLRDPSNTVVPANVTYDATTKTATLTPNAALTANITYTATVAGGNSGVKDLAGNALANNLVWTFTTSDVITLWDSSATPTVLQDSDTSAVTLGVKFRSNTNGYIKAIRFYKGNNNTANYTVNLWNNDTQVSIGSASINNVSATGWQTVNFTTPVAITANTVYVASYFTSIGRYSVNQNYFASTGVNRPPLLALQNGVSGGNGVYRYGSTVGFPNSTYNSSNYWVDVVFSTTP